MHIGLGLFLNQQAGGVSAPAHTDDASLLTLFQPENIVGSPVSAWNDNSGNGRHLTAVGSPTTNGSRVTLNGSSQYLYRDEAVLYDSQGAGAVLAVSDIAGSASFPVVFGESSTADNNPLYIFRATTAEDFRYLVRDDAAVAHADAASIAAPIWPNDANIGIVRMQDFGGDGDEGGIALYRDGLLLGSFSYARGTTTLTTFAIGALRRAAVSLYAPMNLYEFLLTADPSKANMEGHEAIMAATHSVTMATESTIDWDNATASSGNVTINASTGTITKIGTGTEHAFLPIADLSSANIELQFRVTSDGGGEIQAQHADDVAGTNGGTLQNSVNAASPAQNLAPNAIRVATAARNGIRLAITTNAITVAEFRAMQYT